MANNENRDEPESANASAGSFREWLLDRADVLLGAYLSALVVLAYPASLVTLWVQLTNYYGFGYWTAFYATSLVPTTFVVGKVATVFAITLCTGPVILFLCLYVWGYNRYHRAAYNAPGNPLGLEDPDKPKRRYSTTIGQLLFSRERFLAILLVLIAPTIIYPSFAPTSLPTLGTYLAFVALSVIGSYVAVPVVIGAIETESRQGLYRGMAIVYAASVLAAVPLAGLGSPALPTAEMDLGGQNQTVGLLSHSDGYWHVIDQDKAIVHIPDDDIEGTVKVTGVTEKPGY